MHIIYIITDLIKDIKYIGSKKNWKGSNTYFGSPAIKSKNHKKYNLQQQWKLDIKERPNTFIFEILEEVIDPKELNEKELYYQIKNNVVDSFKFINGAYSRKNFYRNKGRSMDKERLKILKDAGTWKTTEEQKIKISIAQTGKKYSDDVNKKKGIKGDKSPNSIKVVIDGIIYESVNSAAFILGINRHTITNRIKKMENYNYLLPNKRIKDL